MLEKNAHSRYPAQLGVAQLDPARFVALWDRCRQPGTRGNADSIFQRLDKGYGSRSRAYHTHKHIAHCLSRFDLVRQRIGNPDAVELCIWFHDLVYEAGAVDNELRSARLFRELAEGQLSAALIDLVDELIMDTLHRREPRTEEGRYMVDIDLSSFGLPWSEFRADSEAVREELSHLSDKEFRVGQARFLRSLLDRPRFYFTDYFREHFESLARANILRYLREIDP